MNFFGSIEVRAPLEKETPLWLIEEGRSMKLYILFRWRLLRVLSLLFLRS